VIIYAYNQHVRLLPPRALVVEQPQSIRVEGADIVMKSSGVSLTPRELAIKTASNTSSASA
jgi:hypothetical protein